MDSSFFIRGLLIGLSIAATVGPMSVLCIQRTLNKGQLYGLVSGLGIATADGVYGSIAAYGLTLITSFLMHEQQWIRLIGGLFLMYLGIKTILSIPPKRAAILNTKTNSYLGAYASTFLLTLTNPLTILSFAAIFAGIGVGSTSKSFFSATAVVLGVFSGSTLWWIILTSIISLLRQKMNAQWLLWINRISGAIITLFGFVALLSLLSIR
ncbi:MAG TPA: LysE family transporter [Ktedonobacteraceae bacterium]|jgi:threonine/homoserine/homoserine lactone efflux protein|nr:LysE family transporter [Ktedonobacteraceae bacterium]